MRACIYARIGRREKGQSGATIDRQVSHCRDLARQHNLIVENRHVFTDGDHEGWWPPKNWAAEGESDVRPALAIMIQAIESGVVSRVILYRATRLGTTSELLLSLRDLVAAHDGAFILSPDAVEAVDDPAERFAVSLLGDRVISDTVAERERKEKLKVRKLEELARLHAKIARIESELAEL